MGIRSVVILVVLVGAMLSLTSTFLVHNKLISPVFSEFEEQVALNNNERPHSVILFAERNLSNICHDWATWDDSWNFAVGNDANFEQSNLLLETFQNLKVDCVIFLDTMNRITWGKLIDHEGTALSDLPVSFADSILGPLNSITRNRIGGLQIVDSVPWIFNAQPIMRSDRSGPQHGWLVMGQKLSTEVLEELAEIAQMPFEIDPMKKGEIATDSTIHTYQKDTIFSRHGIPDIKGESGFWLETSTPRKLMAFSHNQSVIALNLAIAASVIVAVLILFVINRFVIAPLLLLNREMQTIHHRGKYSVRIKHSGCKEIVDLTTMFNALLSRIDLETSELALLSETDGLTGLANRRSFDEAFTMAWKECFDNNTELSIIVIDVDFFKKYNDTLGHQAGDQCLRQVAEVIRRNVLYQHDLPCRYGGEEFAVILPDTKSSGALRVAERIRSELERLAIPHPMSIQGYVTISAGTATVIPSDGSSPERLFSRADAALYRAKESGRNRIESLHES